MAEASNGKSYGATAGTVTIGGNAYKVVDHARGACAVVERARKADSERCVPCV